MLCGFRGSCGCDPTSDRKTQTRSRLFGTFTSGSTGEGKRVDCNGQECPSHTCPPKISVCVVAYDTDTPVGGLADYVLELDGGVMDFEFPSEAVIDSAQNRIALGGGDVRDFHVSGERVIF